MSLSISLGDGVFAAVVGDMKVGAELDEGFGRSAFATFESNEDGGIALAVLGVGVELELGDEITDHFAVAGCGGIVESVSSIMVDMIGVGTELD